MILELIWHLLAWSNMVVWTCPMGVKYRCKVRR
jgi:hypothetical protein